MNAGDIVTVSHIPYRPPRKKEQPGMISATYKPKDRSNNFVLLFLGCEPKDGSMPLDFEKVIRDLGWEPSKRGSGVGG